MQKRYLERCYGSQKAPAQRTHQALGKYHQCDSCGKVNIRLRKDGTQRVHGNYVTA